ncbi:unnamed protein product [Alopecurus aequalis]
MSDVCCLRYLNVSCNPDSAPPCSSYVSPEVYLSFLAAPVALLILLRRNLHPPPPQREQPPDEGPDLILADDADKAVAVSSSVPLPAEPYQSGGSDEEPCRWEEGAVARRVRYPPIRYLEAAGDDDHLFDAIYNWVRGPPLAAGTVGRSDEVAVVLDKMVNALRGILLDIHSCDESTIHPANDVLIDALPYVCTNVETAQSIFATGDYTIEPYSHMFDFWVLKLEDDAERIFQGETGRRNVFLLNNTYEVWQILRRPGASFSNVQLVSRLITMIQRYRRRYFDVCWVPLSKYQRRLNKFTAEFLTISSQQMTWKVTAELKYNLRQEIVDFIIPPYEASLLAMQAKRSRLLGVLLPVKRVMLGKKKQKNYTGEEVENVIRELFEGEEERTLDLSSVRDQNHFFL